MKLKKLFNMMMTFIVVFMAVFPTHLVLASPNNVVERTGHTPGAWPAVFTPYTLENGNPIFDPGADVNPIDVDITSGVDRGVGNLPSFYVASDGTHFFVRLRLKGDPYDRKGGFLSSVWLVKLAVGGQHKATIGLNGKSPHFDYVYVTNTDGSVVNSIYKTTTSGGNVVPGTRIVPAENGHYFLDFQVPISEITEVANEITGTTDVQLFYGTSKAANLSVINKEWMNTDSSGGGTTSFTGLQPIELRNPVLNPNLPVSPPTITISGPAKEKFTSNAITISGTTSVASGVVAIEINGKTKNATNNNGAWNVGISDLIADQSGTYQLIAKVTENGYTVKTTKDIEIEKLTETDRISINGGTVAVTNEARPLLSGPYATNRNGSNYRIYVYISDSNNVIYNTPVDGKDHNTKIWTYTPGVDLKPGKNTITVKMEQTNGTPVAEVVQQLTYVKDQTIQTPLFVVIESVNGDANPAIAGKSSGANSVELQIGGKTIEIVNPNSDGTWTVPTLERPLSSGNHSIIAIAKNSGGEVVTASKSHTVSTTSITIDNGAAVTTNDNTPTIRGNTNSSNQVKVTIGGKEYFSNVSNGRWKVEIPDDESLNNATHTVNVTVDGATATQQLTVKASTSVAISAPGAFISETKPIITGTAEANAAVNLIVRDSNNKVVHSHWFNSVGSEGKWQTTPLTDLAEGDYTVIATAGDLFGNEAIASRNFTIQLAAVPTVSNIDITGDSEIRIPLKDSVSRNYIATVKDQDGYVMGNEEVSWSLQDLVASVGINNGVLTIDSTATTGDVIIVATSLSNPSISGMKTIQLLKEDEKSSAKEIEAFTLPNQKGETVITSNSDAGYISITVGHDTDLNNVIANFTLSPLASITLAGEAQVSGETANDFTAPLNYLVTAEDGSTKPWVVTVTKEVQGKTLPPTINKPVRTGDSKISGTSTEGNALITVTQNGNQLGTTTVEVDGTWTINLADDAILNRLDIIGATAKADDKSVSDEATVNVVSNVTAIESKDNQVVLNNNEALKEITIAQDVVGTQVINSIKATDNSVQSYEIVDSLDALKSDGEKLLSGDKIIVTAEDGTTKGTYTFIHIVIDPPTVTIADPTPNKYYKTSNVNIMGTTNAPLGSELVIKVGDKTYTGVLEPEGWKTVAPITDLPDGTHTASVSITNQGQTGSASVMFIVDTTAPVITLNGNEHIRINVGTSYEDAGASATDNIDGSISNIIVTGEDRVNFSQPGIYTIKYTATDTAGNTSESTRTITVAPLPVKAAGTTNGSQTIDVTEAVPNSTLTLFNQKSEKIGGTGVADSNGNYQFTNVPLAENYSVTQTVNEVESDKSNLVDVLAPNLSDVTTIVGKNDQTVVKVINNNTAEEEVIVYLDSELQNLLDAIQATDDSHQMYRIVDKDNNPITDRTKLIPGDKLIVTAENGREQPYTINIHKIEVDITLTATPNNLLGDGESESTLTALIKDKQGNPISGVKVAFTAEAGILSADYAITNDLGIATVTITSTKIVSTNTVVNNVNATVYDVELGISDQDQIIIKFLPPVIVGQVLDANGKGIAGAKVWVEIDGELYEATTDENGNYSIIVPRGGILDVNIEVTTRIGDREITSSFIQKVNVQVTGQTEEFKPERKVSGQLFLGRDNTIINEMQNVLPANAELVVQVLNDPDHKVTATIDKNGIYELVGFEAGRTYEVVFNVKIENDLFAGKYSKIIVGNDGQIFINFELIDPFGLITDSGDLIPGVDMELYWADTELNKRLGRTPDTLVPLPILPNFPPNQNKNPQVSTDWLQDEDTAEIGNYAWMVFANGDYYLIGKKDGYVTYDSRNDLTTDFEVGDSWMRGGIIHVGNTILRYDFEMERSLNPVTLTGSKGGEGIVTVTGAISGAEVNLYDKDHKKVAEITADSSGNGTFTNIAPGADYSATQKLGNNVSGLSNKVVVEPAKPQTLEGKVDDKAGTVEVSNLIPGAKVQLKDKDGKVISEGTANDQGIFVFTNVEKGVDYTVTQTVNGVESEELNIRLMTDEEAVDDTLRKLKIGYENQFDTWESITNSVFLIRMDTHNTKVEWKSLNDKVVRQPTSLKTTDSCPEQEARDCLITDIIRQKGQDTNVIVRATASLGSITKERQFLLVVKDSEINKGAKVLTGEVVNTPTVSSVPITQEPLFKNGEQFGVIYDVILNSTNASSLNVNPNESAIISLKGQADNNFKKEFTLEIFEQSAVEIAKAKELLVKNDYAELQIAQKDIAHAGMVRVKIVPEIKSQEEVKKAIANSEVSKAQTITPISQPLMVKTNLDSYEGVSYKTTLIIPFDKNGVATIQDYSKLGVFIEHTDGDKSLRHVDKEDEYGNKTYLVYDGQTPIGIAVEVNKFSTFTIVSLSEPASGGGGGSTLPQGAIVSHNVEVDSKTITINFNTSIGSFNKAGFSIKVDGMLVEIKDIYVTDGNRLVIKLKEEVPPGSEVIVHYNAAIGGAHSLLELISNFKILNIDFHKAYIKGFPDGTFKPEENVTRAQMAAMLARNLEFDDSTKASFSLYPDVKVTHWAANVIQFVKDQGLMQGDPTGNFRPDAPITRAEMAAIVARFKELTVVETTVWSFTDNSNHWATGIIEANRNSGILEGYEDGSFRPNRNLTRAEASKVVNRMFDRGPLFGITTPSWPDVKPTHWAYHEIEEASQDHYYTKRPEGGENRITK